MCFWWDEKFLSFKHPKSTLGSTCKYAVMLVCTMGRCLIESGLCRCLSGVPEVDEKATECVL